MDFQLHQEEAKQNTVKLMALLGLGVLAIVLVVSALLVGLFYYDSGTLRPVAALAVAVPVTAAGVIGTSLVKSSQIRGGGGSYVATSLGGRQVDFNTIDPAERQLANVVEEIAIASGMVVPSVFLLDDEPGINAFAAGWTADTAAIGVTKGALVHLNRRELQGVIAHEFSHIRNGDTRVKTRIIGWVFGISVITVLGRLLLQHMWFAPRRRNSKDNSAMLIMAAGVGLLAIGSLGTLFARLIQAAVSRQREFLADASAVQYTRDPSGIGEALIKIGSLGTGNKVQAAHATETSHLFFSSAISTSFATHPPLKNRIRRLVPEWDGNYKELEPALEATAQAGPHGDGPAAVVGSSLVGSEHAFERPAFAGPTEAHIEHTRGLLAQIPSQTQNYLRTHQGAVSAVLGALMSTEPQLRARQLEAVGRDLSMYPGELAAASNIISDLDRSLQLPAIDIALHAIQQTPYDYKIRLGRTILDIERSPDDKDLFRWMLRRVLLTHLADQHDDGSVKHSRPLQDLGNEAKVVLAVLAHFNSSGPNHVQSSFEAALAEIGVETHQAPTVEELGFDLMDEALERLSHLDRPGREAFVTAAAAVVLHDERCTTEEAELLRVVADAVRLPVPPLLPV